MNNRYRIKSYSIPITHYSLPITHYPLYSKEDLENVIYDYGIQKAIEKFILNKKIYENIIHLVENDETKIYIGIAYYIISEYFEFMSFEE